MRVLLQRCSRSVVRVDGDVTGATGVGLVALVGTTHGDTDAVASRLAEQTAKLRVFPDETGRTGRSVMDLGGSVLVVSQFTLYADTRKGTRPSFVRAGEPGEAKRLIECYRVALEGLGVPTASGVFGATMEVELVNDGPFTVLLEREG
ncbi:MAG TPA: D-tyrosyl-tRNA(Tyr) deacylase [Deltaproteobacteria bacterium]|nr:D-tyrosyl-tRNA(Tyr) deacylase [Deltaproteobacteria bacterium]HCP47758.1 D-tyrosyl-tRNA(Tyr) deacylase [Deltaproteobacteria bacterium]